jgi:UrcA family protein
MTHTVLLAAAAAFVLASGCAAPAGARTPFLYNGHTDAPGKVATYTRLRLSRRAAETPAGARALLLQIDAAADAVCGGKAHASVSPRDYDDCHAEATARAVRASALPALEEAWRGGRAAALAATPPSTASLAEKE